jgi:hypothetical protein
MSIGSEDWPSQEVVRITCDKLVKKIRKYPEAATALRETGIEMLDLISSKPEWTNSYYESFHV